MNTEHLRIENLESASRYILARMGDQVLVFADRLVAEIILVERTYILALPFFMPAVIGLAHHQGKLIPLLSLNRLFKSPNALLPEKLTVICLMPTATENLGMAGLIVDRVVGSASAEQYGDLQRQDASDASSQRYVSATELLTQIPSQVWQPQRWHSQ
jgi:chemotaxis signal transduction protein